MREIKLRVYDSGGRMHYLDTEDTDDALVFRSDHHFDGYLFDGDLVVMQYTGFTDSLGVEIYEGDIIEESAKRGVVTFKRGAFVLQYDEGQPLKDVYWKSVVVGNQFEGLRGDD